MIQSFVTPVLNLREIQLILSTPGVFLQNSSTLDLVFRRHIHDYFIPVLYKQKESVRHSIHSNSVPGGHIA